MKIASLLTEFLYQNRYLNIPGIGHFSIDKNLLIPEPDDKEFGLFQQQIQFQNKPVKEADEALIEFIRSKTGKIKPLAIADLQSFLDDCKLFINLGKPIFIEGIGTLSKINTGQLNFTPGASSSQKIDFTISDKHAAKTRLDKKITAWLPTLSGFKMPEKRELILFSGIALALVLLVLGGVLIFKYAGNPSTPAAEERMVETTPAVPPPGVETAPATVEDSSTASELAPSTAPKDYTVTPAAGLRYFKFILQKTTNRDIAESNYRAIKKDRPDLQMETKDSVTYKIFVIQKCAPADTARQKEILNFWYWGKKEMKVYIEG